MTLPDPSRGPDAPAGASDRVVIGPGFVVVGGPVPNDRRDGSEAPAGEGAPSPSPGPDELSEALSSAVEQASLTRGPLRPVRPDEPFSSVAVDLARAGWTLAIGWPLDAAGPVVSLAWSPLLPFEL